MFQVSRYISLMLKFCVTYIFFCFVSACREIVFLFSYVASQSYYCAIMKPPNQLFCFVRSFFHIQTLYTVSSSNRILITHGTGNVCDQNWNNRFVSIFQSLKPSPSWISRHKVSQEAQLAALRTLNKPTRRRMSSSTQDELEGGMPCLIF